eukprot:CAMPEP_0119007208 /NCGR_PEP_ID=MMETSP1176-20130426/2853_1 /TAXON_ID=265551 /ORGANISM="Synedropsis recta cf, Strain CCMP1620" /LENGTH=266 /DNA_ID=CAMNT_0006959311 /DNA_START=87 /DNA_END=883 /DNA_ORIENTATION=-
MTPWAAHLFVIVLVMSNIPLVVSAESREPHHQQQQQCGNTTTSCSSEIQCCKARYSPTSFGCLSNGTFCCTPGPSLEPSPHLPNCLIIGDSVSIGYTPAATLLLQDVCQLQHGPYDTTNGGAGNTKYGLACLPNFLRTQRQTQVKWDVIMFNFGLHDLVNTPEAKAIYRDDLAMIKQQLIAEQPQAKLLYATTTPFMVDAMQNNTIVEDLNRLALEVMSSSDQHIDIVDLHAVVTNHCGDLYEDCSWCNQKPCGMHYNTMGYAALG